MTIKVLGSGCPSCKKLYENTKEAVKRVDSNIEVKYITDLKEIMLSGIMSMPALLIDEKIVSMGRIKSTQEIIDIIRTY